MSLIDTYRKKLEAQIHGHKAQLDSLKAKARRLALQSKFVGEDDLAAADKHLEHIKARYHEMKGAGGSALGDLRTGVKKALADLKASTHKAAQHFDSHPSHAHRRPRTKTAKAARPVKHAAKVMRHSKGARTVKHTVKAVRNSKAARTVKHTMKAVRNSKPVKAGKRAAKPRKPAKKQGH
jgi:hypothetical protein